MCGLLMSQRVWKYTVNSGMWWKCMTNQTLDDVCEKYEECCCFGMMITQTCTLRVCMARGAQRPCALQDAIMVCGQHEEMAWGKLRDWDGTWLPRVPRKAVGQVSPGRNRVMTSDGSSPPSSRRDRLGSSPQSSYRDRLGSSPHSRQAQDNGTPIKKAHEIRQTTMGHLLVTLTTCLHATMITIIDVDLDTHGLKTQQHGFTTLRWINLLLHMVWRPGIGN